ncbi:ABC transporter permease, partial [Kibdelosporangium lantanae]
MGRYVLRRLLQFVPVFLGTTFLVYVLVWAVPGDPFAGMCGDRACPAEFVEAMRTKFGLDQPVVVQYFEYLGRFLTGDFGQTYNNLSIGEQIGNSYPITVRLALVALAIQIVIGGTAGVLTGLRGRGYLDNLVLVATLFLISLPVFVTGSILQLVLGVDWGIIDPTVSADATWGELIVPGFVVGSVSMAYVTRLTRASISENRRADFVRTAIAKG